jgi:hypothetical protein
MFLGNDGKPLVGGKIYTYDSGTTNPRTTYSDAAGLVPNANPIILDSRGEALVFWNGSYRVKLADPLDNVIWTTDSISEIILTYRTGSNGSVIVPYGTTSQRDSVPQLGYFRYNIDTGAFEGYGATGWGSIGGSGGGGTGGGVDVAFFEGDVTINSNFTIGDSAYKPGVTVTLTSPAIFTLANHSLAAEMIVHLKTTGALPTGFAVDVPYYVIATGLTSTTFQLSATLNGIGINANGAQSGVHSIGKIKNAMSAGPISITTGVTVTVPNGATWSII